MAPSHLRSISYEDARQGKPPVAITSAPTPSAARADLHPSLRPATSSPLVGVVRSKLRDDIRRDSGMATSASTARDSRTTFATDTESVASIRPPRINSSRNSSTPSLLPSLGPPAGQQEDEPARPPDAPFLTNLPSFSLEDLSSSGKVAFSRHGSLLIAGRRPSETSIPPSPRVRPNSGSRQPSRSMISLSSSIRSSRILSADEENLSQKVRSRYDSGSDLAVPPSPRTPFVPTKDGSIPEEPAAHPASSPAPSRPQPTHLAPDGVNGGGHSPRPSRRDSCVREDQELAGGLEDWQDVRNEDVDRYGFIVHRRPQSRDESSNALPVSPEPRLHRVSTTLQLASETPRRQRTRLGRRPSNAGSARSMDYHSVRKALKDATARRPASIQGSYRSTASSQFSRIRSAANRLPHNRQRRYLDEAADMLTLPPGLADVAEREEGGRMSERMKRKEWEREEKWRKMAKVVRSGEAGGGMRFEFDTRNSKLVSRTWKGIPDKWRATAWHAFLSASAKRTPGSPTDAELVADFHELLDQASADDVQIDIDVPRTISGHIMFRRRYRGGQRLLFRVLHCLSIYFPETGYVQGMAALAATFLCYFDEELAFVMLVRMWQLRGLDRLYQPGFEGLMQALAEFEDQWLDGGTVAVKLNELCIPPTAYGTRWYLTVFNYSIPFAAQLRVWDVFLLLGDADPTSLQRPAPMPKAPPHPPPATGPYPSAAVSEFPPLVDGSFHGTLDVLHATSAALIDGMREILLDSDFENGMKVLTSWVPIRDENILMRVAKAEWKVHRHKKQS